MTTVGNISEGNAQTADSTDRLSGMFNLLKGAAVGGALMAGFSSGGIGQVATQSYVPMTPPPIVRSSETSAGSTLVGGIAFHDTQSTNTAVDMPPRGGLRHPSLFRNLTETIALESIQLQRFVRAMQRESFHFTSADASEILNQLATIQRGVERAIGLVVSDSESSEATVNAMTTIRHIVAESERLLDLPEDWDDAGSPPVSREAWILATNMLFESVQALDPMQAQTFATPFISPGPDGSVDIVWRTDDHYLLINFRVSDGRPEAGFYGDDGQGNYLIEGTFDPSEDGLWIAQWLTT